MTRACDDVAAFQQVARECGVAVEQLTIWVERSWVRPDRAGGSVTFTDADRARLRMIVEFQRDLEIDDGTMPVVLGLLDRLYAARAQLRDIAAAVAELPETAQIAITRRLQGERDT
jgi:chaperone modulatory protein CbpM